MRKTYTSKVPNTFYVISLHRIISHVRDEKVGNEEATRALIAPSGPRTVNVQLAGRLTDCNIGHRQTCPITITTKVFCQTEIGSNEKRKRETFFSLCSVKINGWNCCDLIWWFFLLFSQGPAGRTLSQCLISGARRWEPFRKHNNHHEDANEMVSCVA